MHEKIWNWSAGKNRSKCMIRYLTLNNENTEHAQLYCWLFIAQTVHIHSLICFIGVCDMFPIQILCLAALWGAVNTMTGLLNHLTDLAVAQICFVEGVFLSSSGGKSVVIAICGYCFDYNLTWSLMMILVVIKITVLMIRDSQLWVFQ